jgi:hypothetical protein
VLLGQDRLEEGVFLVRIRDMRARPGGGSSDFPKDSEYEGKTGWRKW